jgi:hypothetical protein
MKARVFMLAAAIALGAPAAANAATVSVQQLRGDFAAGNSTVIKTPDGVHFGTYADGGAIGGSLYYHGLNGRPLSALTGFGYTFTYRERGNTTGAAPYMRVFLDADPSVDSDNDGNSMNDIDHDIVLDPSICGTAVPPQATDVTFSTDTTTVRYDDDACGTNPQQSFADVVDAHGDETISEILVSQGFSTGEDVSALVRNITVNWTTFAFDVPPVGVPGPPGPPGKPTIVHVPVYVPGQPAAQGVLGEQVSSCAGDDLVMLHVARRGGQRFLSASATLHGKRLKVRGRSIRLDLRGRDEGHYDVRIVARYRTKSGRVVRVVTHRVRGVFCG